MNWRRWKLSALLAGAVMAGNAAAEPPAPVIDSPPPKSALAGPELAGNAAAESPVPVIDSTALKSVPPTPTPASPSPGPGASVPAPNFPAGGPHWPGEGIKDNVFATGVNFNEVTATLAGIGLTSVATATQGFATSGRIATSVTSSPSLLVVPGLFTSLSTESAVPQNRIFMEYGYFDGFQTAYPTGSNQKGFNLSVLNVGAELAFLDGRASVYVRSPFLEATDNITGRAIDGLGDISVGFKYALLTNHVTGSTLSVGLTVDAPTARDTVVTTNTYNSTVPHFPFTLPAATTTTINPTFFQPWVSSLVALDCMYFSSFVGVVVPTANQVFASVNTDLGIGYQIYRSDHPDSCLSSVTPTMSVQVLLPVNHRSSVGIGTSGTSSLIVGANGQLNDASPQSLSINSSPRPSRPKAFRSAWDRGPCYPRAW